MINDINKFHAEYKVVCKPASEALNKATEACNAALKNFIITHICDDEKFNDWKKNIYMDSHIIFDCGRDYITETMILDAMISEIECDLSNQ